MALREDDGFEKLIQEYMAAYDCDRDEAIVMIDQDYFMDDDNLDVEDEMSRDWNEGRGFFDDEGYFDDDDDF